MKILLKPPRSGKTTQALLTSHETRARIITRTNEQAQRLMDLARSLGYEIPTPITYQAYAQYTMANTATTKGLIIDDLEEILKDVFAHEKIHLVTLTDTNCADEPKFVRESPTEAVEKPEHLNLLSSVNKVGETTTQIIHFVSNVKRTIKGVISSSIIEGEMLKFTTKDGRYIIINKNNVLMTEVFPE